MEKLQLPKTIQAVISQIESTPLNFGLFPIDEHPLIPSCRRYIKVYKPISDMEIKRTQISYRQILVDKESNEEIPNTLPTPEWIIYENYTSTLRDEKGQKLLFPVVDSETNEPILDEDGKPKMQPVEVDSHHFLKWLETTKNMTLTQVISSYLPEFYDQNKETLNKLI